MAVDNQSLIATVTSINFRMFSWSDNLEGPSCPQYEIVTLIVVGYDHERKNRLRNYYIHSWQISKAVPNCKHMLFLIYSASTDYTHTLSSKGSAIYNTRLQK